MRNILLCSAAMMCLPLVMARADGITIPQIKEGLWEIEMQDTSSPANVTSHNYYKLCRDHAWDKQAQATINNMKGCTTTLEPLGGGKYTSEGRCTVAGNVIVTDATISTTDTSSHSETHVTYTPAFYGNTGETMIQDQTYLGSCPAGMKPGDRAPG